MDRKTVIKSKLQGIERYQFYPERFNAECARLVLLKAIISMSHSDFTLCKYLIHLEHTKVKENPKIFSAIPGFRESVCRFIVQIISQTYQRISKTLLMSFLDMSENDLKQFIKQFEWSEITDNHHHNQLILINNHEENIKSIQIRERVNFDSITSMSGAFRPSKSDFFIKTNIQS
ncbi:unnamed protein product [Schistosoma margrebowiei]|uniref:Uncharacterized protein n=1 Tax=Schistosoma margrebowiei TaxID=48269 RepID=A0A183LUS9_9TREM|nr:unnamed protein product [Schistosoma margrebowiei]